MGSVALRPALASGLPLSGGGSGCGAQGIGTVRPRPEGRWTALDGWTAAILGGVRGVAQPGSALPLGGRGRRFESGRPDVGLEGRGRALQPLVPRNPRENDPERNRRTAAVVPRHHDDHRPCRTPDSPAPETGLTLGSPWTRRPNARRQISGPLVKRRTTTRPSGTGPHRASRRPAAEEGLRPAARARRLARHGAGEGLPAGALAELPGHPAVSVDALEAAGAAGDPPRDRSRSTGPPCPRCPPRLEVDPQAPLGAPERPDDPRVGGPVGEPPAATEGGLADEGAAEHLALALFGAKAMCVLIRIPSRTRGFSAERAGGIGAAPIARAAGSSSATRLRLRLHRARTGPSSGRRLRRQGEPLTRRRTGQRASPARVQPSALG